MSDFPRHDIDPSHEYIEALAEPELVRAMHDRAESFNTLYKIGHSILEQSLAGRDMPGLDEPILQAAFLSGVKSYEVVGSLVMPAEEQRRYTTMALTPVMKEIVVSDGDYFENYTFAAMLDKISRSTRRHTPCLTHVSTRLAIAELGGDPSPELSERIVNGISAMRLLQLKADRLLDQVVEQEIESNLPGDQ